MRRVGPTLLLAMALMLGAPTAHGQQEQPQHLRVEYNASVAGMQVRSYYHDLVQEVLTRTEAEFGHAILDPVPGSVPQGRLLAQLAHGRLDLLWTTTNRSRETQARPIRIPLDMGMTGQRALVIRADRVAEFDAVENVEHLRKLTACQGAYWPDTDILRASGLRVKEFDWIDMAYPALRDGTCDYLPRAINEIDGEVAAIGGAGLMVYDRLLISYPLPMYLWVARDNDVLATRLETGLAQMVASGRLRQFIETHPATASVFPLTRYRHSRVFRLSNPDLPALTPVQDGRLWLEVSAQPRS